MCVQSSSRTATEHKLDKHFSSPSPSPSPASSSSSYPATSPEMFIPPAGQCRAAVQEAQCTSKDMRGQSDMDHADCEHSLVEDPSSSQCSPSVIQDVDLQSSQAKANPTCQPISHASFSCTREQEFEGGPATEDGETHTSVHDVSHEQHSMDIIESSHPSFRLPPPVLQEGDLQSSLNTGPITTLLHMKRKLSLSLEDKLATESEG